LGKALSQVEHFVHRHPMSAVLVLDGITEMELVAPYAMAVVMEERVDLYVITTQALDAHVVLFQEVPPTTIPSIRLLWEALGVGLGTPRLCARRLMITVAVYSK
jgi:hypothetical protein